MKLRFKTMPVLAGMMMCMTALHAQTDTISGVYLDGERVDTIYCNSFSGMDFVFTLPRNAKYQDYVISEELLLPRGYRPAIKYSTHGQASYHWIYLFSEYINYQTFSFREMENKYLKNGVLVFPNKGRFYSPDFSMYQYALARNHYYRKRFRKDRAAKGIDYIEATLKVSLEGKRPDGIDSSYDTLTHNINFNTSYKYDDIQTYYVKVRLRYVRKESAIKDLPKDCRFKSGTTLDMILKPKAVSTNGTLTPFSENYTSGIVKAQGQKNAAGNAEGTWKYYSEEGKLQRVANFRGGLAHGEWKYYDESGKLFKTEMYENGERSTK